MRTLFGFALLAATLTGCTNITSGQPSSTPVTGEAWYTKDVGLPGLPFSSSVWYCPKEQPDKCTRAEIKTR